MIWPFRRRPERDFDAAIRFFKRVTSNLNADLTAEKSAREQAQTEMRTWMRLYAEAARERDSLRVQTMRDAVSIKMLTEQIDDLQAARSEAA